MLNDTTTSPRPSTGLWSTIENFLRYKVPHAIGLDRAIAFTVLGRVVQGLGSVGTVTCEPAGMTDRSTAIVPTVSDLPEASSGLSERCQALE